MEDGRDRLAASRTRRLRLPLNALRAFEAAARHLSFTRAAGELHVTHAAISQQVRALEERLGLRLFDRDGRGVELTDAGRALAPVVSESFARIAGTLATLQTDIDERTVTVSVTPAFASKWLVPRLARFRARHPEIGLRVAPSLAYVDFGDFGREPCDLAVRCGGGEWPALHVEHLLDIDLVPVASPAVVAGPPRLAEPGDLAAHTLIHADIGGARPLGEEWRTWLDAAGVGGLDLSGGLSFKDPALALEAAADGLGVAIAYPQLAAEDLRSGRLVAPFSRAVRHWYAYYVVCRPERAERPKVRAFRRWLREEAGAAVALDQDQPGRA